MAVCGLLAILLAGVACGSGTEPEPPAALPGDLTAPTMPDPAWRPGEPGAPSPVRVRFPRLRIDAALQPLGLDRRGALRPPAYGRAGWYRNGPEPGEPGSAVIAGHLDSRTGPDVFARLHQAKSGDRIVVVLADRSRLRFQVTRLGTYPQDIFPTRAVYRAPRAGVPVLRLVTCAGAYDRDRGGYQANTVVFAAMLGPGSSAPARDAVR